MRSSVVRRINHHAGLRLTLTNVFNNDACQVANNPLSKCNALASNSILPFRSHSTMLAEVGKFEIRQPDGICYPAGQPFLHRVFGYRGVTLFPWLARVHDIDVRKQSPDDSMESHQMTNSHPILDGTKLQSDKTPTRPLTTMPNTRTKSKQSKESSKDLKEQYVSISKSVTGSSSGGDISNNSEHHQYHHHHMTRFHPYYQVLIDARDCPFVSNRTQTEVATSVGMSWLFGHSDDDSKSVVGTIKGLDYVAHEDIIPYTSHEEQPIQHELHNRLFKYDPDAIPLGGSRFIPTERLKRWQKKHNWLEMSRIYRETTDNIRITVIPFYLGQSTIEDTYWWRYSVRLENFSDVSVQLRERHWKIYSQTNMLQTIKGRGVVGGEPLLTKNEPAYQYSSHVNLQDKSGHMWGTFKMQRVDGYTFECRIPAFSLESSLDISKPASSQHRPLDDDDKV